MKYTKWNVQRVKMIWQYNTLFLFYSNFFSSVPGCSSACPCCGEDGVSAVHRIREGNRQRSGVQLELPLCAAQRFHCQMYVAFMFTLACCMYSVCDPMPPSSDVRRVYFLLYFAVWHFLPTFESSRTLTYGCNDGCLHHTLWQLNLICKPVLISRPHQPVQLRADEDR